MLDALFSFDTLWWVLMLLYIPACIGLIAIVLLQKGKGVGFAGAFGAGGAPGSDTVFGPRMSQSLPVRLTYIAATLFMVIAVVMSLIAGRVGQGQAPELVDDAGVAAAGQVSSGLDAYGIGTNNVDAERLEATEDTGVPAAAMEDEEPATGIADEGAELKPAASNEESETISETTLEEAVGAAEALVESVGEAVNEAAETVEDAVETPTITQ